MLTRHPLHALPPPLIILPHSSPSPPPRQPEFYDTIPEDTAAEAGGTTGFLFLICLLANTMASARCRGASCGWVPAAAPAVAACEEPATAPASRSRAKRAECARPASLPSSLAGHAAGLVLHL